ncbi:MAG: S-adenosylmethionine decarboxylase [Bacteroidota bacterium]
MYNPGSHVLAELKVSDTTLLCEYYAFKDLLDNLIEKHGLQKVGEVYHQFDCAGYTGMVCLTESHISIHTWPEFGIITYDVFLSNFRRDNTEKVHAIHEAIRLFFDGAIIQQTELKR